jgi:hypothetical protein
VQNFMLYLSRLLRTKSRGVADLRSNPAGSLADINGDNKPEIITVNLDDAKVGVSFNTGHGTFTAQTTYLSSEAPRSLAAAYVNDDDQRDIIVADITGINILLTYCPDA